MILLKWIFFHCVWLAALAKLGKCCICKVIYRFGWCNNWFSISVPLVVYVTSVTATVIKK